MKTGESSQMTPHSMISKICFITNKMDQMKMSLWWQEKTLHRYWKDPKRLICSKIKTTNHRGQWPQTCNLLTVEIINWMTNNVINVLSHRVKLKELRVPRMNLNTSQIIHRDFWSSCLMNRRRRGKKMELIITIKMELIVFFNEWCTNIIITDIILTQTANDFIIIINFNFKFNHLIKIFLILNYYFNIYWLNYYKYLVSKLLYKWVILYA